MFLSISPLYWLVIGACTLLSLAASSWVKYQVARAQRIPVQRGLTGRQVADLILADFQVTDVTIVQADGFLTDHYNPWNKTLALSGPIYNGTDAAAVGVAAHEVGHAIQHASHYFPMWVRSVLVPAANIGSTIAPYILMGGIGTYYGAQVAYHGIGHIVMIVGVVLFGMSTLFTLVTVPVEFNASSRAKRRLLELGVTRPGEEADAVNSVLFAAGLTYVAAAVASMLQLLYFAWRAGLLGGSSRERD